MAMWKATGGPDGKSGFNYGPQNTRVEPGEVVDIPPSVSRQLADLGLVEPADKKKAVDPAEVLLVPGGALEPEDGD